MNTWHDGGWEAISRFSMVHDRSFTVPLAEGNMIGVRSVKEVEEELKGEVGECEGDSMDDACPEEPSSSNACRNSITTCNYYLFAEQSIRTKRRGRGKIRGKEVVFHDQGNQGNQGKGPSVCFVVSHVRPLGQHKPANLNQWTHTRMRK
jgi:hypothetical protein